MSVLKNRLKRDFSQIPNSIIEDRQLSHACFRVLCYLYSRPDNWEINNKDIQKRLGIRRRETLAGYWKELESIGYVIRTKAEKKAGQFAGFDYELFFEPCTVETGTVEPDTVGDGHGRTRHGSNRTHSNTKKESNTKLSYTDFLKKTDIKIGKNHFSLLCELTEDGTKFPHGEKFRAGFLNWLAMRTKTGRTYKSKKGIAKQLEMASLFDEEYCLMKIERGITNEYQGLFFENDLVKYEDYKKKRNQLEATVGKKAGVGNVDKNRGF